LSHTSQYAADLLGVAFIGLMGREHVVIGSDDADVDLIRQAQALLVLRRTGGHAVGEIAAGQRPAPPRQRGSLVHLLQIGRTGPRSEEHTSELQSRENLVCRLLLEKKKTETTKKTAPT